MKYKHLQEFYYPRSQKNTKPISKSCKNKKIENRTGKAMKRPPTSLSFPQMVETVHQIHWAIPMARLTTGGWRAQSSMIHIGIMGPGNMGSKSHV